MTSTTIIMVAVMKDFVQVRGGGEVPHPKIVELTTTNNITMNHHQDRFQIRGDDPYQLETTVAIPIKVATTTTLITMSEEEEEV